MYSSELIRKFPENPDKPILFVVYNEEMVAAAEQLIASIHSELYRDRYVTVVPFENRIPENSSVNNYLIYIDPMVYTYKNSWNN